MPFWKQLGNTSTKEWIQAINSKYFKRFIFYENVAENNTKSEKKIVYLVIPWHSLLIYNLHFEFANHENSNLC